jgi:hypothetical protein
MMTLAKEVGIDVPEFGLVPVGSIGNLPAEFSEDKTNAYFVRRFDRGPDIFRFSQPGCRSESGYDPETAARRALVDY